MKRYLNYLLISFILLFYTLSFSIGQISSLSGDIKWLPNLKSNKSGQPDLMYFENAVFIDTGTYLPYFDKHIQLKSDQNFDYKLQISQAEYELFPSEQLPSNLNLEKISDSIIIKYTFQKEKKGLYLQYFFVPLRKNPQSGKIERLKHFELSVEPIPGVRSFKEENAAGFPQQSILSSGNWYKFLVNQTGIYKITYNDLQNLGITDPINVRIFGNGGRMLPEIFSGNIRNDPQEIPIMMVTAGNGTFGTGDYILFYAQGPTVWNFDTTSNTYLYEKNLYSDTTVYFITSMAGGKKIQLANPPSAQPNVLVNSFDGFDYHEADLVNLIKSGRQWYGESFSEQSSYNFIFNFPNLVQSEPVYITSQVVARSVVNTGFVYSQDNNSLGTAVVDSVDETSTTGNYANVACFTDSFLTTNSQINLTLTFNNNGDISASGWLNYIRMVVRQSLSKSDGPLIFRDHRSVGPSNVANFSIANSPADLLVWNVDNINNPEQIQGNFNNNIYSFSAPSDSLHEYIAFDPQNDFYIPTFLSVSKAIIPNQNLHALQNKQYIIVTHPEFLTQAQNLAAFHTQQDHFSTVVVTTDQIYNEFSSGTTDPAAIRNFVKMLYDRAQDTSLMPKYLLLFGNGSYNNKSIIFANGSHNNNYIVTYESVNSLSQTYSYVSDDYFGMLDDNENITTGLLDIGVGRFPVTSAEEATNVVNKIEYYYSNKSFGDWRNSICFVADAGDYNLHEQQADQLATYVTGNYSNLNVQKIYVDAYPAVSTSEGIRAPAVNAAILAQMNIGALIMNYTGHGGETGLSNEMILTNSDVQLWNNNYYPLFITATCELSRFDDYTQTSCGEYIFLNPTGGGIALFTTTRLVYSGPNFVLNSQFYNDAFTLSSDNPSYRLGDMFRITKNEAGADVNKLNFTLLGDPALSLAVPKFFITTDSINQQPASQTDTLKAYGSVGISGRITDGSGSTLTNFNGIIYPTIFDKPEVLNTLGNYDEPSVPFLLQQSILFNGKATVKNGSFSFHCILPRDINYNYGFGKLSYYASDSTADAAGNFQQVVIGGLTTNITSQDSAGPVIRLFMNDTTFRNGGITDPFPTLLAMVSDKNGINTGGNGIGHDITVVLDHNVANTYILDNYYETNINEFTSGMVTYKFPQLSSGMHQLEFTVWDIFNNSSQASLDFKVVSGENIVIQKIYNYPNPMNTYTNFIYEENFDGSIQDVTIDIFNTSGCLVRELKTEIIPDGYTSGPILWDGLDGNGNKILPGIYFYHMIVRSKGQTAMSGAQKLIVIN